MSISHDADIPGHAVVSWRLVKRTVAVLLITLLGACATQSFVKKQGVKIGFTEIEQSAGKPRLQIVITYNDSRSTHSALRLDHPKRGTLFWDPGGAYGKNTDPDRYGWTKVAVRRKNDLVQADTPSLPAYWRFAVSTEDTAMEVLEWILTERRADEFYEILVSGAQDGGRPDGFTTDSAPFYCSISLSDFLRRYGQGLATADKNYFWPSNLAGHLRAQYPHRTLVFSTDEPKATFVSTRAASPSNLSRNPAASR